MHDFLHEPLDRLSVADVVAEHDEVEVGMWALPAPRETADRDDREGSERRPLTTRLEPWPQERDERLGELACEHRAR